uniref:hypothetical protein n=1 Tax=Phaeostrophion irregulare TaxID=243268 RepID=UPI002E763707|nr:hypothetical protein V2492_pgp043 [Phaeostrophion irregulare]WAM64343.1 hypothetical protein [Phaeostrophion irregulare]
MEFVDELRLLIKARYPILYIVTIEEERVEYTIRQAIGNKNLYIWDFLEGYKLNPSQNGFGKRNPLEALNLIEELSYRTPSVFLLRDFKRFLKDLVITRKLRNLTKLLKVDLKTIIIVDSEVQIPEEVVDLVTTVQFHLPNSNEIKKELRRMSRRLVFQGTLSEKVYMKIIQACQGLSLEKIRRVLGKVIILYRRIDSRSIPIILQEKRQVINQTNLLEFWAVKKTLKDVGGAHNLKNWLNARTNAFSEQAVNYGLISPRGVLLIGIQGSGKSLIAKAIAYEWQLPLLRLDVGRLFGGIVGESEKRVRKMITTSESLSPCILWVDELDKAFGESKYSFDSGTTKRVLSTFINWLGEKTLPVFVIGTANDIHSLPVEILRKGRFDEIFYLGIPEVDERQVIFELHLKRFRPETWYRYDIKKLGNKARKFSGAEIEQAITEAMYVAYSEKREFTTEDILVAIKRTVPLVDIDPLRTELVESWAYSGKIRLA